MPRALAVTSLALLLAALSAPLAGAQSPRTVVESPGRDFGEVGKGEVVSETFGIGNAGDATLVIERMEFSAFGMNARVQQRIEPGETAEVELTWDTSQYSGEAVGQARLSTNDRLQPHVLLTLAGVVVPPIEVRPVPALYLSTFAGEPGRQSLTIRNNQDHAVSVTGIEGETGRFETGVETIEPGREYRLDVTVAPGTPVGRWQDRVTVLTDDPEHPRIGIEVNILVKPDVFVTAERLDFGTVDLSALRAAPGRAEMLTQTVLIGRREGPMRLTGVGSDLSFLTVRQAPEGPSDRFRIDVAVDPDALAPGTSEGIVRIQTDDPDFPEIALPARIVVGD